MPTAYQERTDFNEMLKALNVILKRNDDNHKIRYVFEILLQSVRVQEPVNRYKVVYPTEDEICELIDMTVYHHFKTYPSGKRSWHSRPKSVRNICDYLYEMLLSDTFLVAKTTFFWAWIPMMEQMGIPYKRSDYTPWDGSAKNMVVPDFSQHPIFSPITL